MQKIKNAMRKGGQRTMVMDNLVKRLIGSYPNAISVNDDGELDYEDTIYNMSICIVDTMEESQQISVFGKTFETYDECYDHLNIHVFALREGLEIYLHEI